MIDNEKGYNEEDMSPDVNLNINANLDPQQSEKLLRRVFGYAKKKKWWIYAFAWIVVILIGSWMIYKIFFYKSIPANNQTVTNSPNSINTQNQLGGINTINNNYPPSAIVSMSHSYNMPNGNGYNQYLDVIISNPTPNQKFKLTDSKVTISNITNNVLSSGTRTYEGQAPFPYIELGISFSTNTSINPGDVSIQLEQ